MATTEIPGGVAMPVDVAATNTADRQWHLANSALAALASLRLTVILFALLIFLIFAGTLAQVDHGIWYVVDHTYFRVWFAFVEFQAFEALVNMFYRVDWNLPGGCYFPGGWLIGTALAVNLLAAHALRFKIAAEGRRLWLGLATILVGIIATFLIIRSGMDDALESELSATFNNGLWHVLRASVAGLALAGGYLLALYWGRWRHVESCLAAAGVASVGALALWLFINPEVRLDDSGLRILWQLIKGTLAGVVLLVGCVLAFKRRAGIVLLHGGVALMMFSELWTGLTATEGNMTIFEGQSSSYTYDLRSTELAIVDKSPADVDRVTVVPDQLLRDSGTAISHPDLPFNIEVVEFFINSRLRDPESGEANPADSGAGEHVVVEPLDTSAGVAGGEVDQPSVYVHLSHKQSGDPLGTYLLSTAAYGATSATQGVYLPAETVAVDGKSYDVSLRFARKYRDYRLSLVDFRFDRYVATNKPKNYSSLVRLQDAERNVDRDVLIWMNNPLRYRGETFYQADYDAETEQATVLQVVSNPGWMIPYVACMLVAWGMLAHFGLMLVRFVRRRAEETHRTIARAAEHGTDAHRSSALARWVPLVVVLVMAGYVGSKSRAPKLPAHDMQIHEFGKLPVAYEGRIKPLDTVARNTLQVFSGRQEVVAPSIKPKSELPLVGSLINKMRERRGDRIPAIQWLLDVIADTAAADTHRVFRIDNLELLDTLDLENRPGSYRYSLADLRPQIGELIDQSMRASQTSRDDRSPFQASVLLLAEKLERYRLLRDVFSSPELRADREFILQDMQAAEAKVAGMRAAIQDRRSPRKLVLAIPPQQPTGDWQFLLEAELQLLKDRVMGQPMNPATAGFSAILESYARDDARTFNKELKKYRKTIAEYERSLADAETPGMAAAEKLSQSKVDFEVFFNRFSPFYYAAVLYLLAFLLAALSWLGWSLPLNRSAYWLLQFTFVVHTFALVARIYISGRPPVTNLYSSAVFIGWACVLAGLVLESLYRWGVGNIVAAVTGFLTLVIAYNLSLDGDTFVVLQAVLDTQFWLATHVVCITLGYSATFLAGFLGIVFLIAGQLYDQFDGSRRQQLSRMIYGTLCFAIYFSFVGTVLGGLWADDSWGRFWGWDPKENGALIIVLWNALVLHARWGALIGPRGLAALAVGGNIVTSWSWFGVNELGVGLHSYGFSEGTAWWLLMFVLSQLAVIAVGLLTPTRSTRHKARRGKQDPAT